MKRSALREEITFTYNGKEKKLAREIRNYDGKVSRSEMMKIDEQGQWKEVDYDVERDKIIFNINAELEEKNTNG